MIRIKRGREPTTLAPVRRDELVRVQAIAAGGVPSSKDVGDKYQIVKQDLWTRQHFKCCYCEHCCQLGFHDVEHYRPKARADRGPAFSSDGYWWLAWTWANLMFSCPGCNRSGKNDKFPLAAGSVALVAEQAAPGAEVPLLIDPAAESPRAHIQYRPITKNGTLMWIPTGVTDRGARTIRDLGLDRDELMALFAAYSRDYVMPVVTRVQTKIGSGNVPAIRNVWTAEAAPLILPQRPYSRLSFDILDHHFPKALRRKHGLTLKL